MAIKYASLTLYLPHAKVRGELTQSRSGGSGIVGVNTSGGSVGSMII
jgi:hypothetical protein